MFGLLYLLGGEETSEKLKVHFSPTERNHIFLMFPREILIMDLDIHQVCGSARQMWPDLFGHAPESTPRYRRGDRAFLCLYPLTTINHSFPPVGGRHPFGAWNVSICGHVPL